MHADTTDTYAFHKQNILIFVQKTTVYSIQ